MSKCAIRGQKLKHSVDPIKNYEFDKDSIMVKNVDFLFSKKVKRTYKSLLEGEEVEISANGLDLIIKS